MKSCKSPRLKELSRRFLLRQDLYGETVEVIRSVRWILGYINEGRSSEWCNYNYLDWRYGLKEWTRWRLIREVK